jgi:hypothetical protein
MFPDFSTLKPTANAARTAISVASCLATEVLCRYFFWKSNPGEAVLVETSLPAASRVVWNVSLVCPRIRSCRSRTVVELSEKPEVTEPIIWPLLRM